MYLNSSNKLNHVLCEAMKSFKTSTFWLPECWLMKTRTPFSAIAGVAEMLKPNPGDVETIDGDERGDVEVEAQSGEKL